MRVVCLDEKTIRHFLKLYGKGHNSKDCEFLVSILLKRFCELQWGQECCMAFKIKDKYATTSQTSFHSVPLKEVCEILRKQIDEDDTVDVSIVRGTINNPAKEGLSFQLKRFGKNPALDDANALIGYLNDEIPKKYTKTETSLCIIFDTKKEIDFRAVRDSLTIEEYPFNKIMVMYSG